MSEVEILEIKETNPELYEHMLRTDLSFFGEEILGMEISQHHVRWSELVDGYPERLAINAARDHGKSYFFSFAYIIWRVYFNWIPVVPVWMKSVPKHCLGYIFSNTETQAIAFMKIIKDEIFRNPKLHHLMPTEKGMAWAAKDVMFSNGAALKARGWGSSTRGGHPCFVVCDDVLTDDAIYSEMQREKSKDYFFSAITPMVVPGGSIIVVGTPFHSDDLYKALFDNAAYHFEVFPAINDVGQALWPTRYNKETLLKRKEELGSTRFSRELLCVPISDNSSLFPESILKRNYDHEYSMPTQLSAADREDLKIVTGVDFAMSTAVGADYTVITTIGQDRYGNFWILDIKRKKGMQLTEQLLMIQDVYNRYKPVKILLETNQMQRIFLDEMVRRTDLPVEGYNTGKEKGNFEIGVPSLQILFENQKFRIARKTETDRDRTNVLLNELKSFSWIDGKLQGVGSHDDCVMSLWLAVQASRSDSFQFFFG
jgi:hypothetical protein